MDKRCRIEEVNDLSAIASATEDRLSAEDLVYAVEMTIAGAISYWTMTSGLARFVDQASDFLGGMWAAIAIGGIGIVSLLPTGRPAYQLTDFSKRRMM